MFFRRSAAALTPSEHVFPRIYARNEWLCRSGEGSLPAATVPYRTFLQRFLREQGIRSVVDVGCGDWQFSRLVDWSSVRYLGIDVVPSVIENNERCFGTPEISFLCRDVLRSPPPSADLLLLKDVLQHWPGSAIEEAVRWFPRYRFVLVTNDIPTQAYEDTVFGGHRPVDLRLPPFDLAAKEVLRASGTAKVTGKPWTKVTLLLTNPVHQQHPSSPRG